MTGIPRNKTGLNIPLAKGTIEYASKFIRKNIPQAEYWITNRHRWMHNIPTEGCDVVITFSIGIENTILEWLISRLKMTGLNVRVRHNPTKNSYQCYLTAPVHILLKCAEEHHLPKKLSSEFGGGLKEFIKSEENKFEGIEKDIEFFTLQERQWLILKLLESLRFRAGDEISNLKCIEGQVIIPKCLSSGIIAQIYPIHHMPTLKYLRKIWVRTVFNQQPIDDIEKYFGVKIALYFAWLDHYTYALTIPAIVGLIFWLVGFCPISQSVADTGFVLFSFFNVIWFRIYLEAWKRYCAELAYKWGTIDQRDELLVEPRPSFSGPLQRSLVTGRLEPHYPPWKRNIFRCFISLPIIGICICIVLAIMAVSFKLQTWWDKKIINLYSAPLLTFVPRILLGLVISFLDEVYYKVARWLTDKENYRLDRQYENNLIVKVVTFQFVNSFISLFYIAFYLQDQRKLKVQVAVLLITRQIIRNVKESALPYLIEQFRLAKLSFDLFGALTPSGVGKEKRDFSQPRRRRERIKPSASNTIPQAEVESTLFKYEGTVSEHLEMFIQLGYVVLFSSAFPLAACIAFGNNLVAIRSDAFKMCFIYQRPFGERVSNIGMWLNTMEAMGLIAILVNCALIGLSGQVHRMFPNISKTQTILLIVALEHVMLLIRFLISWIIPDKPKWVATEMAKVEFARREAVNRLSSTRTTPPSSDPAESISTVADSACDLPELKIVDKQAPAVFDQSGRNSEKSDCFEAAKDTTCSRKLDDLVKSDFSQLVDSTDRILQNTGEEQKVLVVTEQGRSRGSDSSGDVANTSVSPEPSEGRQLNLKSSIRSTFLSSTRKDLPASTDEHLDRQASNATHSGSWSADARKAAKNSEEGFGACRSTHRVHFAPTEPVSAESAVFSPTAAISRLPVDNNVDSASSETSTGVDMFTEANERKKHLKSALIERVRSVAVFSLKLKERRARAEANSPKSESYTAVGDELPSVPIEMLTSLDDSNVRKRQTKLSSIDDFSTSTPTNPFGHR